MYNHIDDEWKEKGGKWLHVDMAGPSTHDSGRGTGYGVGLLVSLVEELEQASKKIFTKDLSKDTTAYQEVHT